MRDPVSPDFAALNPGYELQVYLIGTSTSMTRLSSGVVSRSL
jgi:hypothetical protein